MASPRLGLHPATRLLALTALAATSVACTRDNPAFDLDEYADGTDEIAGDGDPTGDGDGDGDPTTGDGDGDPTTGDGDGDPTTGDGDGDPTTGDGDGDPTTGDGDGDPTTGDGDGDPTTGDGDGDPTTGDGDGDDPNLCATPVPFDDYSPFVVESLSEVVTNTAPGFDSAPENCHLMLICPADADFCDANNPYLVKAYSSGSHYSGQGAPNPTAIQIRFQSGGGACDGASLDLDPNNYISLQVWNGMGFEMFPIRFPCLTEYDVPLYVATDGSTFWDPEFQEAAALWD